MIVVADASPFVVLVAIGHVDVLPTLFREVLEKAFDRVRQTDFWISHALLDERLAQFRQRRPAP